LNSIDWAAPMMMQKRSAAEDEVLLRCCFVMVVCRDYCKQPITIIS
jgi:hypothetical protein